MSGRKQHYVPRLVLRGFEAVKTRKGTSQVWWFPKDKDAVCTAVDNVFAQRDFYKNPDSDLDDKLTEMESRLGQFVNQARTLVIPEQVSSISEAVDLCHTMSMRSRWIREMFERVGHTALNFVSDQLSNSEGVLAILKKQSEEDPDWLRDSFIQEATRQAERSLDDQEIAFLESKASQVSNNWEEVVPHLDTSALQQLLSILGVQMSQIAKTGHVTGVTKSLPGNSLREFLVNLDWRIELYAPNSLILGDCGPLLLDESGGILGPMGVPGKSEIAGIFFPISHSHLLIGGHCEPAKMNDIVTETAAWSMDAFVSSEDSPTCVAAQDLIRSNVDRWFTKDLDLKADT